MAQLGDFVHRIDRLITLDATALIP